MIKEKRQIKISKTFYSNYNNVALVLNDVCIYEV